MTPTPSSAISTGEYGQARKQVIVFLIILTLAAIAAMAWKERESLESARNLLRIELQLQSQSLGSLFETSFESAEQTLSGVAYRMETNPVKTGTSFDLRKRMLRSPSMSDLRVYDANHALLERAGLASLANNELPAWAKEEINRGRNTGFSKDGDSIAFYRTARSREGVVLGTAYCTLPADYFQNFSAQNLFSNTRTSFLVGPDSAMVMVISQDDDAEYQQATAMVRKIDAEFGGHGSRINEVDGKLIVMQQLRNHPLRVVQISPPEIAVDRWKGGAVYSLVFVVLIVLAAVIFITYLRRSDRLNRQLLSDLHRMNLVIEQSPVPVVITDLNANIVYVNNAFVQNSGYSTEEVMGRNPRQLQSGLTDPAIFKELWGKLTEGVPWRGTLINRRKNGEHFREESFVAPLRNLQGNITHYFAVKIDVTAQRLGEEKLLETQARLQASHDLLYRLSRHIPGVIYQFRLYPDGRTCFPYASEGMKDVYGFSPESVRDDASEVFKRLHPDDAERFYASIRQSAQQMSIWHEEYRVQYVEGETRWVSGLANPMALEDGSILWHGFVKDITDRKLLEQKIADHDRDMNTILENSSVGIIFVKDRCGVWANGRMAELFGYTLAEISGRNTRMFYLSQESYDELGLSGYADISQGRRFITEKPMRHKDGHAIWMRLSGKAVDVSRPEAGSIWVFEDISVQKNLESNLRLAASVFTHAREGIMITDAEGSIVDLNETFVRITGYSREEALGQNPRMLGSGRQGAEFYAGMWRSLLDKGHWYGEVWNRRKSGDLYAEMLTISSVRDAAGQIQNYVALFSDITPIKEHQQQLEHIAHYDALTNLPNRVLLGDRLRQAIIQCQRRGKCLAVVFLDLDGFKLVNDNHGHAAGDSLLMAVAQHLQTAMREGDTLARIGGDEFVAVLSDLENAHDCEPILERMLKAATQPVNYDGASLHVSASMGVSLYPQDGSEVDLLMRQADQAMYIAKQAGKHRYHLFDGLQDAAMRQQRESLERMEQALHQGEFVLFYQPKVNIRTRTVEGVEALLRWAHPERGLLSPAEFLPVLENKPLSLQFGDWVLRTALSQMRHWQAQGNTIPVSINISAMHLQKADFVDQMRGLLQEFPEIRPADIELEVLETSAFDDLQKVRSIIARCQEAGLTFALDDFGTGYSSLTYLKHLPVETLKIDQSFVRDMLDDPNDFAIVDGVIGLARAFGRRVIAEGVETQAHCALLLSMGCEVAQGYGIAKPMEASKLVGWMVQWSQQPASTPDDATLATAAATAASGA